MLFERLPFPVRQWWWWWWWWWLVWSSMIVVLVLVLALVTGNVPNWNRLRRFGLFAIVVRPFHGF